MKAFAMKSTQLSVTIIVSLLLLLACQQASAATPSPSPPPSPSTQPTDSTSGLLPTTSYVPQDQYLQVDTANAVGGPSTNGNSTVSIECGNSSSNPNQQLVGITESYVEIEPITRPGPIVATGDVPSSWNSPMPREPQYYGNFLYLPRCNSVSSFNLSCSGTDWVQEYTSIDTLTISCANNHYYWENLNANPIVGTTSRPLSP